MMVKYTSDDHLPNFQFYASRNFFRLMKEDFSDNVDILELEKNISFFNLAYKNSNEVLTQTITLAWYKGQSLESLINYNCSNQKSLSSEHMLTVEEINKIKNQNFNLNLTCQVYKIKGNFVF